MTIPELTIFLAETQLTASSHAEFLAQRLNVCERSIENVIFMVYDNDSVNKYLATKLEIPMIACNSHRLNLGSKRYLELHEEMLNKLQNSNLDEKLLAKLRKKTPLHPLFHLNSANFSILSGNCAWLIVTSFVYTIDRVRSEKTHRSRGIQLDILL